MLKSGDKIYINGVEMIYEGSTKDTEGLVCSCGCKKEATARMYQLSSASHLVNGEKDILSFREQCFRKLKDKISYVPYPLNHNQDVAVDHLRKIEISRAVLSKLNHSDINTEEKCRFDDIWNSVYEQVQNWYNGLPTLHRLNKTNINGAVKWLRKYKDITVSYKNIDLDNFK